LLRTGRLKREIPVPHVSENRCEIQPLAIVGRHGVGHHEPPWCRAKAKCVL
jgi:hypothetical protein